LWYVAVAGGQRAIAIVRGERCYGPGGDVGHGGLGVAYDCWYTYAPLHGRLGEFLEGGCTIEGTIGQHRRQAIGDVQLMRMGAYHLGNVLGRTAVAPERLR
jgi:hypothetical protein